MQWMNKNFLASDIWLYSSVYSGSQPLSVKVWIFSLRLLFLQFLYLQFIFEGYFNHSLQTSPAWIVRYFICLCHLVARFALLSSKPVLCWSGVALGWSQWVLSYFYSHTVNDPVLVKLCWVIWFWVMMVARRTSLTIIPYLTME